MISHLDLRESPPDKASSSKSPTSDLTSSEIFDKPGRFTRLFFNPKVLQKGVYGKVQVATSHIDGKVYAVKEVYFKRVKGETSQKLKEAVHMARLNHHRLVRYYSAWLEIDKKRTSLTEYFGEKGEQLIEPEILEDQPEECSLFIVMKNYSKTLASEDPSFLKENFKKLTTQVLEAVEYLHTNSYLHLDIHSGNILMRESGDVVLSDFGTLQRMKPNVIPTLTLSMQKYLPGEDGSPAADVWMVGNLMLDMYDHGGNYRILPSDLRALYDLMCHDDSAQRPSATEALRQLLELGPAGEEDLPTRIAALERANAVKDARIKKLEETVEKQTEQIQKQSEEIKMLKEQIKMLIEYNKDLVSKTLLFIDQQRNDAMKRYAENWSENFLLEALFDVLKSESDASIVWDRNLIFSVNSCESLSKKVIISTNNKEWTAKKCMKRINTYADEVKTATNYPILLKAGPRKYRLNSNLDGIKEGVQV